MKMILLPMFRSSCSVEFKLKTSELFHLNKSPPQVDDTMNYDSFIVGFDIEEFKTIRNAGKKLIRFFNFSDPHHFSPVIKTIFNIGGYFT